MDKRGDDMAQATQTRVASDVTVRRRRRDGLPPGPPPLPVVGHALQFRRDPLAFVQGLQRSYGGMATFYMGKAPMVLLARPEYARYVLVDHARNFTSREFAFGLRGILGDGLLTSDGDFHRQQRRLVQPAFHKKRVEGYARIMVEHTQQTLDEWQTGQQIDMAAAMQDLTLRIVAKALFDVDLKTDSRGLGDAFNAVINNPVQMPFSWRSIPLNLPFMPYAKHMAGRAILDTYIYSLIAKRRASGDDTGDLISMLLAAQDGGVTMTDRQVRDQTLTLLAAGHETTANLLAWTFYLLSAHPNIRAKLLGELRSVLKGQTLEVDDLPKLPYLDWVISESMRMYPPAWTVGRRAIESFELGGYTFPAGQMVMINQWVLHHLPEVWGDPYTFRPERWEPSQARAIPAGAYFPFGAGPRMCIGMPFAQLEARLLLATILQRFTPEVVPGWPVVPRPRITLRPKYGMQMTLA